MKVKSKEHLVSCEDGKKIEIASGILLTGRHIFCIVWTEKSKRGKTVIVKCFESRKCRKEYIQKEELTDYTVFRGMLKKGKIILSKKLFMNEKTVMMCDEEGIELMSIGDWRRRMLNLSDQIARDMDELETRGFTLWEIH